MSGNRPGADVGGDMSPIGGGFRRRWRIVGPSDRRPIRRLAGAIVAALTTAAIVGGCQVRPLYAELGGPGVVGPRGELKAVQVDPPKTRAEQALRNELVFRLTGGSDDVPEPRYNLRYLLSESSSSLAIEREEDLPGAVLVTLNATFILTDLADGRTLMSGSTFAAATFDFSSQRFANVRARRDAEDRAAVSIAENIGVRLAAYFASRT